MSEVTKDETRSRIAMPQPPLEKSTWRHNSAAVGAIWMKYGNPRLLHRALKIGSKHAPKQ